MSAAPHVPVMLREVLQVLAPRAQAIYVDGTFGAGGYTRALLAAAACRVLAIDRDPEAIAAGRALEAESAGRLTLRAGRFGDMDRIAAEAGMAPVDGVALDFGVSSMQLDEPARGFSFRHDGPLDMRMEAVGTTAAELVDTLSESELADIIWRFGEERHARRVARALVAARPVATTAALAAVVRGAVPPARDGIDPATRTFQALRIAVNDELGEIGRGLSAAERLLAAGGRLAVVAFHSLEDRPVKAFLRERSGATARPSRHSPAAPPPPCRPSFRLISRRPMLPQADEIAANPRARSARLRAAERTDAPAWSEAA